MARFYGWNLADIEAMEFEEFMQGWLAITMIEAQETLINFRVADFPNLDSKERKKLHREMSREAYFQDETRAVQVQDLQNMYGMSDISEVLKGKK